MGQELSTALGSLKSNTSSLMEFGQIVSGSSQESNRQPVVKEEITLPDANKKLAFVLHNVFSLEECRTFIEQTEKIGYEMALINVGGGRQKLMPEYRNSYRCIVDSEECVAVLWERVKEYIPTSFGGRDVIGLNERLRFLRYDPGQYFKPHYDGSYVSDTGERSLITFQAYLNEGFEGGATTFLGRNDKVEIFPKTGSVIIFEHNIYHEGSELKSGRKYAVRTDVMYTDL